MPKPTTEMLIEAGLIPADTVAQLVRWRALPEEMLEKVGLHPVSLEQNSAEAAKFADSLAKQMESEDRLIRETELDVMGDEVKVIIQFSDGSLSATVVATIDKFGQVHVPTSVFLNGRQRKIKGISFDGHPDNIRRVISQDPRFSGDLATSIVCQLEEEEADEVTESNA